MIVRLSKEIKVLLWLLLSLVDDHHHNAVVDDESNEDKQRDKGSPPLGLVVGADDEQHDPGAPLFAGLSSC